MGSVANKKSMTIDDLRELHDTLAVLKRDMRIYKLLLYHGLSTYVPPSLPAHEHHERFNHYSDQEYHRPVSQPLQPHGHAVLLLGLLSFVLFS